MISMKTVFYGYDRILRLRCPRGRGDALRLATGTRKGGLPSVEGFKGTQWWGAVAVASCAAARTIAATE